ncbi:hypothetical protein AVANS14531_05230 [Campylobacter sp. Cr9]|uniref:hypothetical protein n=1 Tax=Campylobacter sp. Cr9 TaxID=2735728 RepID=UPI00301514F0|nr:hypothetical protein [Campylobacter sp. Cr9]
MLIRYDFKINLKDFGIFLSHIAKKININYKLFYENNEFSLELNDASEKILEFNELIKKVPYFLFLQDFNVSEEKSEKRKEFEIGISKLPLNLCDEIFDDLALKVQNYEKTNESDFVVIANYELLQKAFVCDKNTQILLNSYEKPFIKLAPKSLYKKAHNLKDFLYVGFANNKDLYNELKESNELYYIKQSENALIIKPYNDTFCIIQNPYTNELSNAFNIDKLSFKLPKNKASLIKLLKGLEHGEKLLANYEKKFSLSDFELVEDNIFALIKLANIILESDVLKLVPNNYTKGVRVDFIIDENGLNIAKLISSLMSFRLANAAMIEVGFFEGLVKMLGNLNTDERYISTKLIEYSSFLSYNAFLNPHLKISKWANSECFN